MRKIDFATPREIAEIIADDTGEPVADMLVRLRLQREAAGEWFPRGDFGAGMPARSTPRSAAVQLLGWSSERANTVVEHVKKISRLRFDPESYTQPVFIGSGADRVIALLRGRTFLDAVTSLIQCCRDPQLAAHVLEAVIELGVTQWKGGVCAWIAPRPSREWRAQHESPVRIIFGETVAGAGLSRQEMVISPLLLNRIANSLGPRKRKESSVDALHEGSDGTALRDFVGPAHGE